MAITLLSPEGAPLGNNTNINYGDLLIDDTLSSGVASVSITGIPAIYKHLKLVCYLRSTAASVAFINFRIRLNDDSGANYDISGVEANGSTVVAKESFADTYWIFEDLLPAATATANVFGAFEIIIANYAVSADKRAGYLHGGHVGDPSSSNTQRILLHTCSWRNTADAINRIDFSSSTGNIDTDSRYTLYGLV